MEYFSDPYKKYYEKLKEITSVISDSEEISSKISESSKIITNIKSSLSNSGWKELGIDTLSNKTIPSLINNIQILEKNIEGVLKAVCNKAINELLPELEKLKTDAEKYDDVQKELDNLVVPVRYDKDNEETSLYREYINKKTELTKTLNDLSIKCNEYRKNCDRIVTEIKSLDGKITEFPKVSISTSTGNNTQIEVIDGEANGTMYKVKINGTEFLVANTKTNLFEYETYVQKIGAYQNAGYMGSRCDLLSQQIAVDLLKGTMTRKAIYGDSTSGVAMRIQNSVRSQSKEEVMKYMYEEVSNGRPVVIQVTQKRSNEGLRHFVTMVGYDSSVKSYKDLTPDKILVMDCVDGKVQKLSDRNRQLFNQSGNGYLATGASKDFLAKEVMKTNTKTNA